VDGDLSGKIFEPFAASADGRFMDGSGLGLTVATRVARLMGGEVSFASTTGVGTTFTLELEVKTSNN
jgi:osomolarity two-component system sensor histidine kinase SLN1